MKIKQATVKPFAHNINRYDEVRNTSDGGFTSHRVAWVGMVKDHLVPTPLQWAQVNIMK